MATIIAPTPISAFPSPLPNVVDPAFRQQALQWVNHLTNIKVGEFNAMLANVNNNATAAHEQAQTAELSRNQAQAAATQAINAAATSGAASGAVAWSTSGSYSAGGGATPPATVFDPDNSPGITYRCTSSVGPTATRPKDDPTHWAALTASFATGLPVPISNRFLAWDAAGAQVVNVDLSATTGAARIGVQDGASASTVAAMLARVSGVADAGQVIDKSEAEIANAAATGALVRNRFYRSTSPNKLFFATSPSSYFQVNAGGGGGSSWVPKVVVIGDSSAAQHPLHSDCWPEVWATRMRNLGAPINLVNLAVGGWTWNKANTIATFDGKTAVERAIIEAPDVIIIALGANDAVLNVEGRTLAQTQTDASSALNALRSALPAAVICVVSEFLYDNTCFTSPGSLLLNKGTVPYLMQRPASGLLSGAWGTEMLEDSVSATQKANFSNWISLDAHVRSHSAVNGSFPMQLWRAIRLGGASLDGVHVNMMGNQLLAGYALKGARSAAALLAVWPQLNANTLQDWTDPDYVFTSMLTQSGSSWLTKSAAAAWSALLVAKQFGGTPLLRPDTWWAASGGNVMPAESAITSVMTSMVASGCAPRSQLQVSVDGGAFSAAGWPMTDARGDALALAKNSAFTPGTRQLRFRVADEVFGPYTVTVVAVADPPPPGGGGQDPYVPPPPVDIRAYLQTSQSVTADTWTTVALSGVANNRGGGSWSGSTYTVPKAGMYAVSFVINVQRDPPSDAAWPYLASEVRKNGSRAFVGMTNAMNENRVGDSQGPYMGTGGSSALYLSAGDTITLHLLSSAACSITSSSVSELCLFRIGD